MLNFAQRPIPVYNFNYLYLSCREFFPVYRIEKTRLLIPEFMLSTTGKLIILLILTSFSFTISLKSQDLFPGGGFLYSDNEVARIDITIDQVYLDLILDYENRESDIEYPATFKMTRGVEVRTVDSVGFRLRGNTSRGSAKKSFKVSVNSFYRGRTFQGVEKININGEHNDPTIARAKICWDLFREMGVPAPRASHVELYINGEYRGLYINVEHIDEEFVDLRFGNNDGNLYKCLWPADLDYLGSDPDLYKFTSGERRAYDLKRNEELDNYSDLAHLIEIINNTSPGDFPEFLEPVFNVNSYLKNLVVEIIAGHWDAYSYLKNNYYLYHNEETGKFEYIPYDTDNTFGIDWFNIDWTTRDIYNWSNQGEPRPLTVNILQNQLYRDRFSFYMNRFLDRYFNTEVLYPEIDALRDMISAFAYDDLYRTYDYGFTYQDFYNSFDYPVGMHVKQGLKSYVSARYNSAMEQLEAVNVPPIISQVRTNSPVAGEDMIFTALVEDEDTPSNVRVFVWDGSGFGLTDMQAVGQETWRAIVPSTGTAGLLQYYVEATDVLDQTTREPATGYYTLDIGTSVRGYFSEDKVRIYPNPFSSNLTITIPDHYAGFSYMITDISGRIIATGESHDSSLVLNTDAQNYSRGIYLVHVKFLDPHGMVTGNQVIKGIYEE